jgi:plasmid stability protein
MSKMIQIRNVPDDVHVKLKMRAAQQGMTLSDYLKQELLHIAEAPTLEEMIEWSRRQPPIDLGEPIEDIIRAERESH